MSSLLCHSQSSLISVPRLPSLQSEICLKLFKGFKLKLLYQMSRTRYKIKLARVLGENSRVFHTYPFSLASLSSTCIQTSQKNCCRIWQVRAKTDKEQKSKGTLETTGINLDCFRVFSWWIKDHREKIWHLRCNSG